MESASSSATSGLQFGDNNASGSQTGLIVAASVLGGLVFLAALIWLAVHKK